MYDVLAFLFAIYIPEGEYKRTYALLAFEKVAEILGREVVPVGESDEKEVDLRTSGHLLEHGHELAAVDPPTLRR